MNNQSVIYGISHHNNQLSLIGINLFTTWDGMMSLLGGDYTPGTIGTENQEGVYGTIGSIKVNDKSPYFVISSSGSLYERPTFTSGPDRVSKIG